MLFNFAGFLIFCCVLCNLLMTVSQMMCIYISAYFSLLCILSLLFVFVVWTNMDPMALVKLPTTCALDNPRTHSPLYTNRSDLEFQNHIRKPWMKSSSMASKSAMRSVALVHERKPPFPSMNGHGCIA